MKVGFYILLVMLCIGCHESETVELPAEKMADVILDLTIADQVINLYQPRERDSIRQELMKNLLRIHSLERAELDTNLYLYMTDFDKYSTVEKLLKARVDSLDVHLTLK